MSAPTTQRDAAAAVKATDAIRRLGVQPAKPSITEDLEKAAPKSSKVPMGLIVASFVTLALISSIGGVYMAGVLSPPVREKLKTVPVVGHYLFPDKTGTAGTTASSPGAATTPGSTSNTPAPSVPGDQMSLAMQAITQAQAKVITDQKVLQADQDKFKQQQADLDKQKKDFAAQKAQWEASLKTLDNQVAIAQNMKPAAAAAMFDGLADDLVAQILAKMPQEDSARILSAMDPFRAARLYDKMSTGLTGAGVDMLPPAPAGQTAPAAPATQNQPGTLSIGGQ